MRRLLLVVFVLTFGMMGNALAGVVARIDISKQMMTVSEDGRVLYSWPVSTARARYHTPRGTFRPIRMHKMWYSHKYHMSPMPHSIFFHGGYAIHGTNAVSYLGRPASHGCVRLHPSNAAKLYRLVQQNGAGNTRIIVQN
jgi:lipoprotein-anchoring transpeptidase ErfK/SrfK